MPMTSSRFWSITGKRECAVEMICGMKLSTGSLMSMKSTWARGTMMSRTCISETVSAPSMIDRASASSRLREYAPRRSCTSCSRSPGSRISSADRRSSRLGREGSFTGRLFYFVGIVEPEASQDSHLHALHARRFPFLFMIVAAQVKKAVDDQVCVVRRDGFSLRAGLAHDYRMTQADVAAHFPVRESQHVRRLFFSSEGSVEPPAFARADDADHHIGLCPAAERSGTRHAAARHRVLDEDFILPACASRRHR